MTLTPISRTVFTLALLLWMPPAASCSSMQELRIADVARFDFSSESGGQGPQLAEGLSGIVHLVDNQYLAVSDQHASLQRLTIVVDPVSGRILEASFQTPLRLTDLSGRPYPNPDPSMDREGVAADVRGGTVWIASERTSGDMGVPSIARHSLETGQMMELLPLSCESPPRVFCSARDNQSLESLTRDPEGTAIWTANEQSLMVDGGSPSRAEGAVVRLQRFDDRLVAGPQYVYRTESLSSATPQPVVQLGISGLVDLLALPGGTLLSVERAVVGDPDSGFPVMRIRVYEIDLVGATDVSEPPFDRGLLQTREPYSPVGKKLLVELRGGLGPGANFNFEGIALGPRLENGDYSLILIADNGTGTVQTLYALRLSGLPASEQ